MASVKLIAYPPVNGKQAISIRVIHQRVVKYVDTLMRIPEGSWQDGFVNTKTRDHAKLNRELQDKLDIAQSCADETRTRSINPAALTRYIEARVNPKTTSSTMSEVLKGMELGRGLARISAVAVNVFVTWRGYDPDLMELDYKMLNDFKAHLLKKKRSQATVNRYLVVYMNLWNEARKLGLIPRVESPFEKGLSARSRPTKKEPLTIAHLRILKELRPTLKGSQREAVNALLLVFYCQGADIIDLCQVTKKDIKGGYIPIDRYKNRSRASSETKVKIIPPISEILSEYKHKRFIFPMVEDIERDYAEYSGIMRSWLRRLETVQENWNKVNETKLPHMTFKSARHAWTTRAAELKIPYEVRQWALGHVRDEVTDAYHDNKQAEIDEANEKVCDF